MKMKMKKKTFRDCKLYYVYFHFIFYVIDGKTLLLLLLLCNSFPYKESSLVNIFPWNCLLFVYERSLVQNTYIVHEQTLFSGMNVCMFFVRLFRTFFSFLLFKSYKRKKNTKKFDVILACLVESLFKFYMV